MLEPSYAAHVAHVLDVLEADDGRQELWRAIVEKLTLICADPDGKASRQRMIRSSTGTLFRLTEVRVPAEKDDWVIIWAPDGPDAVFTYIGPWPPSSTR